ncbi:Endonuclease/exonuclease/phosphatase [Dissophora ornata]|nr:Endonuclease/exonuclease/phosphatase [Dissophora ornata]
MNESTQLLVLTLNCWGLTFMPKDRRDRMSAIGRHLADTISTAGSGYDIVGLQEVWAHDDFLLIRDLVKKSLPFAKHWTSGLFGSGLVVLSKYPIKSTSLRRYALNGDPLPFLHGDWFDGKSCASAVITHPTIGEIEVFNTHMHATYDPLGTQDRYLGCRLAQAWEMAGQIRTSTALGRHVIALGDFNSAPNSLVVSLLGRYAGLTDSWASLHPIDQDSLPKGLSPEQGVTLLGVTCDTPLNSWTSHAAWANQLTGDPIGERLDYIFFNRSSRGTGSGMEMECSQVDVVLQERVAGIGGSTKNVSDHFAVRAVFSFNKIHPHRHQHNLRQLSQTHAQISSEIQNDEDTVELLEHVLVALEQHLIRAQKKSMWTLAILTPMFLIGTLGLLLGFLWVDHLYDDNRDINNNNIGNNNKAWGSTASSTSRTAVLMLMAIGLSMFSSSWVACIFYGFFFGGETVSAYANVIQEVQGTIERCNYHSNNNNTINISNSQ